MNAHIIEGEAIPGLEDEPSTAPQPKPTGQAIATAEPPRPPARATQNEADRLMNTLLTALKNGADAGAIERMVELQRQMVADQRRAIFAEALGNMMLHMPSVSKRGLITITDKNDRNKVIQSTPYALWEDIHKVITPILHQHGFSLTFRTSYPEGRVAVTAVLLHKTGHQEETTVVLPHDSGGSKNGVQAVGSSISYGKRYAGCAILNINVGGEDDDGQAAGRAGEEADPVITGAQHEELASLATRARANMDVFLGQVLRVPSLADLPRSRFMEAKNKLLAKIEAMQANGGSR
jgi:hypothetical protein